MLSMANSAVWSRLLGSPNELATSLFDRYHIVAPADLRDAALKVEANQRQEQEAIRNSSAPEFGRVWVGARRRNRTVTSWKSLPVFPHASPERRPNERFSRRGHRGCQQAESRPDDGGLERRSGLRPKAACLKREIVCGRILLGRRTNLPLRNEPGRSFRSVCFLWSAAHERRDAAHQGTCLRLLRRD
jgi:hypothetical protein